MDESFLSISPAGRGQLVKMLITLEQYSSFGSSLADLFILTLFNHCYANFAERHFGGSRYFVKKLITLELHDILYQMLHTYYTF